MPKKILELAIGRETGVPGIQNEDIIVWDNGQIQYLAEDENQHINSTVISFQLDTSVTEGLQRKVNALKPTTLVDTTPTAPMCTNTELFYWYAYKYDGNKVVLQLKSFCHIRAMIDNEAVSEVVTILSGFYNLARLGNERN